MCGSPIPCLELLAPRILHGHNMYSAQHKIDMATKWTCRGTKTRWARNRRKAEKHTKEEHVVHHLLFGQRLYTHELQWLVWKQDTRTEVHLCVVGVILWHECLDMSNFARAAAMRLRGGCFSVQTPQY